MMKVVRASEGELRVVQGMAEVVFRHTYRDILSQEQMEYMMVWMYSLPNLRKQVEDGHVYFIAWKGDVPCGYVSVQYQSDADDGRMLFHLHKIYVMPSEQGGGVGRLLFDTAVAYVREMAGNRTASVELNVNRNNPAVGFYQRLGLKILRQGDFPIGNGFYMNDYIMGLDITPGYQ